MEVKKNKKIILISLIILTGLFLPRFFVHADQTTSSATVVNSDPTALADNISGDAIVYAGQEHSVTAIYSDNNLYSDLADCYLKIDHDSVTDIEMHFTESGETGSGDVIVDAGGDYLIGTPTYTYTSSGNNLTAVFSFTLDWDWTESSDVEYSVKAIDDDSAESTYSVTDDDVQFEDDLIVYNPSFTVSGSALEDDDWIAGASQVTATGTIVYQGTTNIYPPSSATIYAQLWANGVDLGDDYQDEINYVTGAYAISPYTVGSATDTDYDFKIEIEDIPTNGTDETPDGTTIDSRIDADAPANLSLSFSSATAESITVQVSGATDSGSGVAEYYFLQDQDTSEWQAGVSWQDTGLSPNTEYTYQVKAKDQVGNASAYTAEQSKYTLANIPGAPTLENSSTSAELTINTNSNSTATEYAIAISSDSWVTTDYVQINNSFDTGIIWQTLANWGSPLTITGLAQDTEYKYKIKARNSDSPQIATDFGAEASGSTNSAPNIVINSVSQAQDATGYVTINYTLTDAQEDTCSLADYEYSLDALEWSNLTVQSGDIADLSSGQAYDLVWDAETDLISPTEDAEVYIRLKPSDASLEGSYATSDAFIIDTKNPISLANISAGTPTSSEVGLTWTACSDSNFSHYEIWYGTSQSSVQNRSALEWDYSDDSSLSTVSITSTTITGLNSNATYYFKIWAIDSYGNELTIDDISTQTKSSGGGVPLIFVTGSAPSTPVQPELEPEPESEPEKTEIIYSENPKIKGQTEPGSEIIIRIADKTYTIKANQMGEWSYSLPQDLEIGNYKIEIKTKKAGQESDLVNINLQIKKQDQAQTWYLPDMPIISMPRQGEILIKPKLSAKIQDRVATAKQINKLNLNIPKLEQVDISIQKDLIKIVENMPGITNIINNLNPNALSSTVNNIKSVGLKSKSIFIPKMAEYEFFANVPAIPSDLSFFVEPNNEFELTSTLEIFPEKQEQKLYISKGKTVKSVIRPSKPANAVFAEFVLKSTYQSPKQSFNFISSAHALELIKSVFAKDYVLDQKIVYNDDNKDGVWEAMVKAPVVEGEFILRTTIDYKDPSLEDKKIETITLIDPEGYVFRKIDNSELRIKGAIVSLYLFDEKTNKYNLWDPGDSNQPNPQVTSQTGQYAFLVPQGKYFLKIEADNYKTVKLAPFDVIESNSVHQNIELKPKTPWLSYLIDIRILIGLFLIILISSINLLRKKIK